MKRIKFLGAFVITLLFSIFSLNTVYGISATLSPSPSSVLQGNTFTVRVSLSSDVCAATFNVSYNTSKLTLVSGDTSCAWAEGEALPSYTFRANSGVTGSASISLSGTASDTNYNPSGLSGSTAVTITAPVVTTPTKVTTTPTTNTNSNTNLKKLVPNYEGLSPNFNPAVTKYSLTVPSTATSLGLTVGVEQAGAKYWINGENNLQMGDNTVTVTVTATDGTKKVYTIIVTKAADVAKANAYLSSIVIDGKTLYPDFTAENLQYDIGKVASNIEKLTVLAYAQSENAKVETTGNDKLVDGENIIKIKVTAEDGTTTKEYTVKVTKDIAEVVQSSATKEVNIYPESNSLQNINHSSGFSNFMQGIGMYLENFGLVLSLLMMCLFELWQIVYLYIKVEKFKKTGSMDNKEILNLEDKDSKLRRRNNEVENENNKSFSKIFNSEDEKIDDEDNTDNFEDTKDVEEDK